MTSLRAQLGKPIRLGVVVMLLFGYVCMAALIEEQSNVIESQRTLIRSLFGDSVKLTSLKVKEAREQQRNK